MLTLTQKLEDKVASIEENYDHSNKDFVIDEVLRWAAFYWLGLNEDDFCLQSGGGEVMVFGGLNRLIWTPSRGYQVDTGSPQFKARYEGIGPLPGLPGLAR